MNDINLDRIISVNIFGSCVSRDVLEYQKERIIQPKNYIARESIISALSMPVPLDTEKLKINSDFQRRMVEHDFRKDVFKVFQKEQADFVVIDFIEERFPLAKIGDSYVTYSNELAVSGYLENPELIQTQKKIKERIFGNGEIWKIDQKKLDIYIAKFAKKILRLYHQKQIIIHEVYLSDYYMSGERKISSFSEYHLKNNLQMNEKYQYMYQELEKKIPNAYVINCSKDYVADENHVWGLSPMHFQKEYYENVLEEISDYTMKMGEQQWRMRFKYLKKLF